MSFDHYRARLKKAAWDWMEKRVWWFRGVRKVRKDRRDGRAEKRGARQEVRREIDGERE